ncbi:DUF1329 domain-containing protein [Parvibaculum sp.]|jgi:hypothetical protein|uniref:DUF1329 domain-containing protein n=1 Tax=Parvibaculum sp. TaxID=2024848 RepID=UPI002FD90BA0
MSLSKRIWGIAATSFLLAGAASAGVPASQVERLGQDLTPMGAERAGNADGSIPAWTGGLSSPPEGLAPVPEGHYADPFADDPVLFTITKENLGEHEDALTPGQRAMLEIYPNYKLNVYPSRRSCALPEEVYGAIRKNAANGSLGGGGDSLADVVHGVPFPIPSNAYEIVWNHNLRYRGYKVSRTFVSAAPTRDGNFTPIKVQDDLIFDYSAPGISSLDELDNTSFRYLQETLSPARRAGQLLLVHEIVDPSRGERRSWQYTTGRTDSAPRVQRTSAINYDTPQIYSDAMSTADSFDVFSGPLDRFDWKFLGIEERYIAYNSYELSSPDHKYADIIKPGHLNQDLVRYEKHRVWTVEAVVKPTQRHVYSRRVAYFDEDGYNMAAGELYDARGGLWRVQEAHLIQYYDVPTCFNASDVVYDLVEGRCVVQNLKNEEDGIVFDADELNDMMFVPEELRRRINRR